MQKKIRIIGVFAFLLLWFGGCSPDEEVSHPAPEFKTSTPENEAVGVRLSTKVEIVFDEVVTLSSNHGITINDATADVATSFTKLLFTVDLAGSTTYEIVIPKGAVINNFNVPLATELRLSFTTEEPVLRDTSALQFVTKMGVGWNLGNTLDTKDADETAWGNPKATQALIDAVAAKGFETLRVPITWQYHMGAAPDYTIEKAWLDRVEEVVNYGLSNNMTVIINVHHDEEWLIPTYAEVDRVEDQLAKVWAQIAVRFKEYDNSLVFETLNETRLKGSANEWSGGTDEGRDCINRFHQAAVDAIRGTGGQNSDRYIMISTYAASANQVAMNDLVLPSSTNLIVSIHNYYPYELCLGENGKTWGTVIEKQALDNEFNRIHDLFVANGIPVVMGEWGNLNHDNLADRVKHAKHYANGCIARGICPIWWDNGNANDFALIDRNTYEWIFPEIADVIESAYFAGR